ncbi:MAG: hypothetical protein ACXVNP_00950 [Bacteroidia bacterium]
MATNLARSFFWWHPETDIQFIIVTDDVGGFPADVIKRSKITVIKPGQMGEGFSPKLHLDLLAPEGQTLFIDSDCLVFGKLDSVFDRFAGKQVSVIGSYLSEGDWYGDVTKICKNLKINKLPKFNGGIYYLEKGETATKVYETAREVEKNYDKIGLTRFRNTTADEIIMSIALELNDQTPIPDDATIMSDPQACPGKYNINVISGQRKLINPTFPDPLHRSWYPFHNVSPLVVHFLGYFTQHYPYKREVFKLGKAVNGRLSIIDNLIAVVTIEYPDRFKNFVKDTFRPLFRQLFGTRKVKTSQRVITPNA